MYLYDISSLYILSDRNWIRQGCVWLITWRWFDYFIIIAIIINSFVLAATDYTHRLDPNYFSLWTQTQNDIDLVFSGIFIAEAVIKIVA